MPRFTMLLSFGLAGLALAGCSNANQQNEDALLQENRGLRDRLEQSQVDYATMQDENRRLEFQLEESNQRLSDQAAMPPAGISEFGPGVEVFQRGNETVVRIQGDVLFASGQDSLRTTAKTTLAAIASQLQATYPNMEIRVTGFTDTDPIKKSGFKSNYHLGFARAYVVGQYLGKHGISPDRVSYATFGPADPLSSKSKSRRVEVSVFSE